MTPAAMVSDLNTVPVALGDRSYDILIGSGLLSRAGEEITRRLTTTRVAIVTDENVAELYLDTLTKNLKSSSISWTPVIVAPGEQSKNFTTLETVTNAVLTAKLERGDAIIALGGGVVGDLAGFVAGITRRGMDFIQMPTSLLAQIDSSIGGKTGINTAAGKNLVGLFYQPRLVLADTDVLNTLSRREFRAGYAEIVKYGLMNSSDFFAWLEKNWKAIFTGGAERTQAITCSCQAKAMIITCDEREMGDRALLNLGHTFGHALETATNYDSARLVHGEAISIGIVLAHQFSAHMNLISPNDATRVETHLKAVGLPVSLSNIPGRVPPPEKLMEYIVQDKKISRGALTFILTRGIGQAFIARDVPPEAVLSFLQEKYSI